MEQPAAPAKLWFKKEFETFEQSLNGGAGNTFHQRRKDAFAKISELGLPTPQQEEWKYTNLASLAKLPFKSASPGALELEALLPYLIHGADTQRLVFVNGRFSPELSAHTKLRGVECGSIAAMIKKDDARITKHLSRYADFSADALTALNTAFLQDGAVVYVPRQSVSELPLQILFVTTAEETSVTYPRVLIVAEQGSKIQIIETYAGVGTNTYLTNAVTEASVEENAEVDHYKLGLEGSGAYHLGLVRSQQAQNSRFSTQVFTFGGKLVRNSVHCVIGGKGIHATLNGLTVLDQEQHVDNHTVIDHAAAHAESHEHYRGIYAGKSKGIFNGTIIVRPDSQKTNAYQSNQSVLLSDQASSHSRPQLKIWADDVKCSHGATVGQLDEDALFYLRSRGIPEKAARNILVHAFASKVLQGVKDPALKQFLETTLTAKLNQLVM